MKPSLKTQLPLSYLLIALLATVVLGLVLLGSLRFSYAAQQARYLEQSGRLMSENLSQFLATQPAPKALQSLVRRLNQSSAARIRVLTANQTKFDMIQFLDASLFNGFARTNREGGS
jgi:hypothetical protein